MYKCICTAILHVPMERVHRKNNTSKLDNDAKREANIYGFTQELITIQHELGLDQTWKEETSLASSAIDIKCILVHTRAHRAHTYTVQKREHSTHATLCKCGDGSVMDIKIEEGEEY